LTNMYCAAFFGALVLYLLCHLFGWLCLSLLMLSHSSFII
jgi:hypothetical protein